MNRDGCFDARVYEFVATQSDPASVGQWVDRIAHRILDVLPAMASDPYLAGVIRGSAESQWKAFLASMTQPEQDVQMVPSAAEMAVEIARRGRTMQELFQIYRIARRGVWEHITGVLMEQAVDTESTAFLIFFWNRASHWIDAVVESSATLFEDERDQVRLGAAAQRLETVREILERRSTANPRDLSEALNGHPVSGSNTALVLSASDADKVSELRAVAFELAKFAGVRNPLIVNPGGRDLWVWLSTVKEPSLAQLVTAKPELTARGIRVAVGAPGEGVEGFRQSHSEAQHAKKIAAVAKKDLANPLYFPDVETLAMLWQSSEQAVRFVQRTLGDLYKDNEAMDRLRQTARVTLRVGSVEKAAAVLIVHKNTVRYRLSQIEKILGRDLNEAPIALALALDYHEAFLAGN
ncbi:PucR family transcriptional regulator [Nocardia sp. NPDC059228]|uniref:PucR family transcriptional regulator n=1 Tax=Nocardia sp. NPDC059228 TaxID=3346777 RepID=UPI0036AA7251